MDSTYVVVGAGLAGAATAWRLASAGQQVTLIEAWTPAHLGGSSHGSARIFRHAYPDTFHAGMTVRALDGWRELEAESGERLLTITGGLDFGAGRDLDGIVSSLSALALDFERLTAAAARERWPQLAFDGPVVHHPGAGVVDAQLAVRTMVDRAELAGAQVLTGARVTAIAKTASGFTVSVAEAPETLPGSPARTSATFEAKSVVVAAGAWLPELLVDLPIPDAVRASFPTLTVSQQQTFFFHSPQGGEPWPIWVHKDELSVYALPGGSDVQHAALKIAEHDGGSVTTASGRDGVVDAGSRERIIRYVEKYVPGIDPTPIAQTTCLYTSTPSTDFLIDSVDGLVIASPCSGHGAKFAPLLGELIADVARGATAPEPFLLSSHH